MDTKDDGSLKNPLRNLILVISVVFLISGLMTGEYLDVWSKAVMICMECIGLG